jgi:AcrR family transcriptional regulator
MSAKRTVSSKQRRRRGRPAHDSAETRAALLDAAEEFFATVGVEGASMRSISAAAGLTHAAVNYHYPSKGALLDAVIARRGERIACRFDELLVQLEATGRQPSAEDLIEAITIPHVELLEDDAVGGRRWLQIEARLMLAEDPHLLRQSYLSAETRERIWRLIQRGFPTVPKALRRTAWYISTATLLQMLGNSDVRFARTARGAASRAMQTYIDTLSRFAASGFAAVMAAADNGSTPGRPRR